MALPRLPAAGADEIEAQLEAAGCLVIERAIDAATSEAVRQELAETFLRTPTGEGHFFGRNTRRFSAIFARSDAAAELALQPEILAAIERSLLGPSSAPHADCIQITLTQAIQIEPGEPAQIIHRDDELYPFPKPFEVMVNVMWPLDDFTESNGATRLAPGSHRWERLLPEPDGPGVVGAACPAGGAIIWLGSVVHGGGANRTGCPRRGLLISYSLAWLAQTEKLLLSIPPARVRSLPERLQRLIGYQVHRPNLGWIEGRDPLEWLRGMSGEAAAVDHLTSEQIELLNQLIAGRSTAH
jgi:ectoine hydroxylase-related dioxygenase (phytanoyl-CoA dioxygenase family)